MESHSSHARPLERYTSILASLERHRSWTQSIGPFRRAAVSLLATEAAPDDLADALYHVADQLKEQSSWTDPIRSDARFAVAAILLHRGIEPETYFSAVKAFGDALGARKMRRSSIHESLAVLALLERDNFINPEQVDRFVALYEMMKKYH